MSFDLKLFGGKLERCRTQLQLDYNDVFYKTGIDQDRLQKLEAGLSEPTGDEVLIFADFYKQNYNYFISNQLETASEQVDILYRKFGSNFNKEDRLAIRDFIFLCESEDFIFKSIEINKIDFNYVPSGVYMKGHGEEAAKALRTKFRLKDDQIIGDPYNIFRQLGIHIFRRKLSNSDISGLFINHPLAGKCVLVNYEEDIYRQNFTLAHEIAHSIFDFNESVTISFGKWSKNDLKEIRANAFASNFLIPKGIFEKYDPRKFNEPQILAFANQLQVNIKPLLIAMKESGKINGEQYDRFVNLKIPSSHKIDPELKNISKNYFIAKSELLQRGMSSFYVRKAYECYNANIISAGKFAEMLLCNEGELNRLLNLFDLKLSYGN